MGIGAFAGGDGKQYLAVLRGIRQARPGLPFVVVTRIPETSDWLDALEAGTIDYCSAPLELREISWLMETVLRRPEAQLPERRRQSSTLPGFAKR